MGLIKYDETYFNLSKEDAKNSSDYLQVTKNNAIDVSNNIPSNYGDAENVKIAASELSDICSVDDSINLTYDNWLSLLTNMSAVNSEGYYKIDLEDGTKYINFDDSILIYVTQGAERDSDGTPYPLDQYVMGVVEGEYNGIMWGSMYYHGEMTKDQYLNALKACSIVVRSYGLSQTVYNTAKGHDVDHKIQSSANKQCFNVRLFTNTGKYKAWELLSSTTAAAVVETTGIVFGNDERPLSLYYYDGGEMAKIREYALQDMDYIEILETVYADQFETDGGLKYYDYSTQTILGDVSDDTEISKLIGNNLSNDEVENSSTQWTYTLDSNTGSRTATVSTTLGEYGSNVIADGNTMNGVSGSTENIYYKREETPELDIAVNTISQENPTTTTVEIEEPVIEYEKETPTVERKSKIDIINERLETLDKEIIEPTAEPVVEYEEEKPEAIEEIEQAEEVKEPEITEEVDVTDTAKPSPSKPDPSPNKPDPSPNKPDSAQTTSEPVNILPDNKFSEEIPEITSGSLNEMEISTNHVRYEIGSISETEYSKYINNIKNAGYSLSEDGTYWIKGNYKITLEYNSNNLILLINSLTDI